MFNLRTGSNGSYRVPLFRNCVDFDYASMYPNNSIQFNVSHETMVGVVSMNNNQGINYSNNNLFNFYLPSSEGTYINDLLFADNYTAMCTDILNLPTISETYDILMDKYKNETRMKPFMVIGEETIYAA